MNKKPNILLISVDTLRADHLSCYGYPTNTSPHIDQLASENVLFDQAYATAGWTPPSHASMFTGLYPSEHGVVNNNQLVESIPTIAQILYDDGYHTGGFVNNSQVGQLVGFDRGHETFIEVWKGHQSNNVFEKAVRYLNRQTHKLTGKYDKGAKQTNRLALRWLDRYSKGKKPFYLFLHYIEPHNPLNPHREHWNKQATSCFRSGINWKKIQKMAENPLRFYTDECTLNREETDYLISLYDGEIFYVDQIIGEVINYLKMNKLYENTMIIITSDHGEHFGEKGNFSHVSSLYQPIIHIPLVVKFPYLLGENKKISRKVQLVDILPTILDTAGVQIPSQCHISGVNLREAINNATPFRNHIIAEWEGRIPFFILNELGCDESDERVSRFNHKIYTIIGDSHKFIMSEDKEELYDIVSDPLEANDLIQEDPDTAKRLKINLLTWLDKKNSREIHHKPSIVDEEIIRNLKSLGYV
mgnify:CR=1 FL=1